MRIRPVQWLQSHIVKPKDRLRVDVDCLIKNYDTLKDAVENLRREVEYLEAKCENAIYESKDATANTMRLTERLAFLPEFPHPLDPVKKQILEDINAGVAKKNELWLADIREKMGKAIEPYLKDRSEPLIICPTCGATCDGKAKWLEHEKTHKEK